MGVSFENEIPFIIQRQDIQYLLHVNTSIYTTFGTISIAYFIQYFHIDICRQNTLYHNNTCTIKENRHLHLVHFQHKKI